MKAQIERPFSLSKFQENIPKFESRLPIDEKPDDTIGKRKETIQVSPYIAYPDLEKAVELAIALRRPLLLEGEPGCGKTELAKAVAYQLYGQDFEKHYFEWNIKSITRASDGVYTFDHIARLRDAQLDVIKNKAVTEEAFGVKLKSEEPKHYINRGVLYRAFKASKKDAPSIILIDEIDKADDDFPNDLLLELDKFRFWIEETKEEVVAEERPIVFITSNDEKKLPPAFLRRCLFHFVRFPDSDHLIKIIKAHKGDFDETLIPLAVKKFTDWRMRLKEGGFSGKNITTSELLDWVQLLKHFDVSSKVLESEELVFPEALLKNRHDVFNLLGKKNT